MTTETTSMTSEELLEKIKESIAKKDRAMVSFYVRERLRVLGLEIMKKREETLKMF